MQYCVTWKQFKTEPQKGLYINELARCVEGGFIITVDSCRTLGDLWQQRDYKNLKVLIRKYGVFNTIKYAMAYDNLELIYFLEDQMKINLQNYDKIKDERNKFMSLIDVAEKYESDEIINYLEEKGFTEYAYKEGIELEQIGLILSNYDLVKERINKQSLNVLGEQRGGFSRLCLNNNRIKDWNGITFKWVKQCIQIEYGFTNNVSAIKLVKQCKKAYNNCSRNITSFLADLKRREDLILKKEREKIDQENLQLEINDEKSRIKSLDKQIELDELKSITKKDRVKNKKDKQQKQKEIDSLLLKIFEKELKK